ncbi:MAG TPA: carboxypeptidase-like regulatory domain-containing protein [Kofleriaceae bacterium]
MTLASRVSVFAIASAAIAAAGAPAHAQSAEAEALFRDGRGLIKAGKIAPGCDKLAASERLESSVGTLLNLGDCRERLGQVASAWAAFRKAEALARRTGGDEKRQAEAERRARALEPRLANLVIQVDHRIDGLIVRRDDEQVDDAGWNTALPVDPGRYTITAEAPGYTAWRTTITVAPGATRQVVEVPNLVRAAPPPVEVAAAPWPPPRPYSMRPAPERGTWSATRGVSAVLAIAGAGALGTGIYFGIHAHQLEDRANVRCPEAQCSDPEGLRLNDQARTSALRANVLYIAGGAALATATVLWFVGAPDEIVVTPVASAAGGDHQLGFAMTGRF